MTILPKKKAGKEKNESEKSSEHQLAPVSPNTEARQGSRRPPSPPARWNSPTPVDIREERVPSHVDPGGIFEEYSAHDGASSHNKRRHRSSPLRSVRKHRHERHERSTVPQWDIPVSSASTVSASSSSHLHASFLPVASTSNETEASAEELNTVEDGEDFGGYNSGDEYNAQPQNISEDIEELERCFEEALKEKRGFIIKKMGEDGACLFRAVADQIYGDQEMHSSVRNHCVDYMAKNKDFFKAYVTEDFNLYLARKRLDHSHGNNVEMQAICELFNRPVEVYQYSTDPINTFQATVDSDYEPIRLSYHRSMHYNSVVNPRKATIGVGLGLPGLQPGLAEKNQMRDAKRVSEDHHIEQTMLEDKLRETDWEVTQEVLEEKVARESYLQWLRDQEKTSRQSTSASATCSVASEAPQGQWWEEPSNPPHPPSLSPHSQPSSSVSQSQNCADINKAPSPQLSLPVTCLSPAQMPSCSSARSPLRPSATECTDDGAASSFHATFAETTSLMNDFPPHLYGLSDWGEEEIMAQVMAQSQCEYLETLKRTAASPATVRHPSPGPSTS
ncbi:hypothetical protein CAPTEDRAFT_227475 [Capitella teleta]|uniref:ubiquitinyl hydrolase 1 n=1 Tax=Capitella teleta TaxID=283909 RepID=R7UZA6_CAPTE|nr:hypothetical protein CAPTEDRAFT_227475 [Capitella teleta]|eukprot:ELU11592.1 hypothetical protein CAPTEDRAFT_227475 [Capitella teleta]